ncbi:MAG: 50S ribosomal protein L21e [Candidatus Aenigmarchaeota archaeon]|nr:50S ribosomal protein L21e [Candidatus Aenigmarchaeota archaeon]
MVRKSHGSKVKSRKKLTQKPGYRPTITKFLKSFEIGQKVAIDQEPSSQKGMPYSKFKGLTGDIIGKRGNSYIIAVKVGNSTKKIIARPEHIKSN